MGCVSTREHLVKEWKGSAMKSVHFKKRKRNSEFFATENLSFPVEVKQVTYRNISTHDSKNTSVSKKGDNLVGRISQAQNNGLIKLPTLRYQTPGRTFNIKRNFDLNPSLFKKLPKKQINKSPVPQKRTMQNTICFNTFRPSLDDVSE